MPSSNTISKKQRKPSDEACGDNQGVEKEIKDVKKKKKVINYQAREQDGDSEYDDDEYGGVEEEGEGEEDDEEEDDE